MLISIVIATYKPNLCYLYEQLKSLNEQTYKNIEIIIRDDSEDEKIFTDIKNLATNTLYNFDFTINKNKVNIGSNKTFELLTEECKGDYIAYCDQDDVWKFDKIEKLVKQIDEECIMVYSNLSLLDSKNNKKVRRLKSIRKRIKYIEGENLFKYFIRRNCVTGCTMLVKREIAINSIPFNKYYVHDHWISLNASRLGKIKFIDEDLIQYRIHENNQIGASKMIGINSKKSYINNKLEFEKDRLEYLGITLTLNNFEKNILYYNFKILEKRIDMMQNKNKKSLIWCLKNLNYDFMLIGFEVLVTITPNILSKKLISKIKNSKF